MIITSVGVEVVSSSESPRSYNVITENGHGLGDVSGRPRSNFMTKMMIMPLTHMSILQV